MASMLMSNEASDHQKLLQVDLMEIIFRAAKHGLLPDRLVQQLGNQVNKLSRYLSVSLPINMSGSGHDTPRSPASQAQAPAA